MELELANARIELSKSTDRSTNLQKILQEKEKAFEILRSDFLLIQNDVEIKDKTILEKDEALEHLRENLMELERQERDMVSVTAPDSTIAQLQAELTQVTQEKMTLLQTVKRTHEHHLIEVATIREKSREVEWSLEGSRNRISELEKKVAELNAIIKGDSVGDKSQSSSKKRSRK
jgi:uncharacterized protein involved in exopolysaccharide biosynthesis